MPVIFISFGLMDTLSAFVSKTEYKNRMPCRQILKTSDFFGWDVFPSVIPIRSKTFQIRRALYFSHGMMSNKFYDPEKN